MGGVAKLTSNPRTRNGVRTVRCELGSSGYPATARIHDRPGEHFPYKKGDRVTYRKVAGDPAAGVIITGIYGSDGSASNSANRVVSGRDADLELKAPSGATRVTGKDGVRLGTGDDGDQKAIAIGEEIDRDTKSIQAQLDQALAAISAADETLAAALLTEMQKVIPGWTPLPYAGTGEVRAPDAKHAADVLAKPED
jgi:hypothetical protein